MYHKWLLTFFAATGDILRMPYADSVAPDKPVHSDRIVTLIVCTFYKLDDSVAVEKAALDLHCPIMACYSTEKQ